jgi:2Fe-2S ferredoxin
MVAITYIEHDGTRHCVDVDEGANLMIGATLNMVPGVEGMCGGICSCATCHCYVPKSWQQRIPAPTQGELDMLEAATDRRESSRLGCQVTVTAEMEGMEVHLPEVQGMGH